MWKDYSAGYLKNNKASGVSIIAAAFISTLFLSLLCCLFYNIWQDEIRGIVLEEGDWQGRIRGELDDEALTAIRNFANVERAERNEALSEEQETVVDITFQNPRTIFQDMPLITKKLGLPKEAAEYHLLLLSRYLIHDPADEEPPLLMTFYLVVLAAASLSLILIIHNSFAVSMNVRIHQFGIFSSVGASPGQILACLMQEAAFLCMVPVLSGSLLGIALCYGVICAANRLTMGMPGRREVFFSYHPAVFAGTVALSALTVLLSAWLPAKRLSRLTPLEAIRSREDMQVKRKKGFGLLKLFFGTEGELAAASLKAQKRALRTSRLSLTLSFLAFTVMLCFFTLSDISTNHTYFERYQDAWDVMVTVKDTPIGEFGLTQEVNGLQGIRDCIVYQKAQAVSLIPKEDISKELQRLGGLEAVAGTGVSADDSVYRIQAPIIILDDDSFAAYCEQLGTAPRMDGAIVLNRIRDSINSNFRYPAYIPYVRQSGKTILLQDAAENKKALEIPVTAYAQEPPVLREEYEQNVLVQVVPLSLWRRISEQLGGSEPELYIRVLAKEGASYAELAAMEDELLQIVEGGYEAEAENRIGKKRANDRMILGYKMILGGFCSLLAVIGIANVFSNTLGFLRMRKREIARYRSVGMTTRQLRKLFCAEALSIAGRPLLITLPLTAVLVEAMITASYLDPMEFWAQAPLVPVAVFALAVFGFVGLAYYLGGKKVLGCDMAEALRDDTMI